jgi:hypothetical protein
MSELEVIARQISRFNDAVTARKVLSALPDGAGRPGQDHFHRPGKGHGAYDGSRGPRGTSPGLSRGRYELHYGILPPYAEEPTGIALLRVMGHPSGSLNRDPATRWSRTEYAANDALVMRFGPLAGMVFAIPASQPFAQGFAKGALRTMQDYEVHDGGPGHRSLPEPDRHTGPRREARSRVHVAGSTCTSERASSGAPQYSRSSATSRSCTSTGIQRAPASAR